MNKDRINIFNEAYDSALHILNTLRKAGFLAYFAGGWVRDFLLNIPSSDIDIATNALPEEIAKLFPRSLLVGAQFGVVIVREQKFQFEVATFRSDLEYKDGRKPEKVILQSSPKEDAQRRDFTINGMFYDPIDEKVIDYVEGQKDLQAKIIRTIGDPALRFKEDRLRMIRAIRFSKKFGFHLDDATKNALRTYSSTLLPAVSMERIWHELSKMRSGPNFKEALLEMAELGLLQAIFPRLKETSLEVLKERLRGIEKVTVAIPVILILANLFEKNDTSFLLELAPYLKASSDDTLWVETWLDAQVLLEKPNTFENHYEWAYFFANPKETPCLEVILCKLPEKEELQKKLQLLKKQLSAHIQRLLSRKPLVKAQDLQKYGIGPSKELGELLKEAEKIAIINDLSDTNAVISKLQQTALWKKLVKTSC